jgi:hypothetical protein
MPAAARYLANLVPSANAIGKAAASGGDEARDNVTMGPEVETFLGEFFAQHPTASVEDGVAAYEQATTQVRPGMVNLFSPMSIFTQSREQRAQDLERHIAQKGKRLRREATEKARRLTKTDIDRLYARYLQELQ